MKTTNTGRTGRTQRFDHTQRNDRIDRIDRMVADAAPDPGPGLTPGARELLDEIVATPAAGPAYAPSRPPHPRLRLRRPRMLATVAAGLAVVAVLLSWVVPGAPGLGSRPAAADALDIKREGTFFIITVKDLLADPQRYERELRAHGIAITLRVVPATPSAVGTLDGPFGMVYDGLSEVQSTQPPDHISSIEPAGACAARRTCVIGIRVPVRYYVVAAPRRAMAVVTLGRAARPGERYQILAPLQAPGEPLQCIDFIDKTVAQVTALLRKHGVARADFFDGTAWHSSVPGTWRVHEGFMSEPGEATMLVSPTRARPHVPGPELTGDYCSDGPGN